MGFVPTARWGADQGLPLEQVLLGALVSLGKKDQGDTTCCQLQCAKDGSIA